MSIFKYGLAAVLISSAAGCNGLSDYQEARDLLRENQETADIGRQLQRAAAVTDRLDRIDALSNTAFDAVPTSGSAAYKGNFFLYLNQAGTIAEDAVIVGDSDIVIDFGNPGNAVTGTVDTLRQAFPSPFDISEPVEGEVVISTGAVGIGGTPNNLGLQYDGALELDGNDIAFDGFAVGKLRGTRTQLNPGQSTVRAFEVLDDDVNVIADDGSFTARAIFNGEN